MVYLAEIEHYCSRAYGSQIRLGCITKACLGLCRLTSAICQGDAAPCRCCEPRGADSACLIHRAGCSVGAKGT
jgi:hypothetical protein